MRSLARGHGVAAVSLAAKDHDVDAGHMVAAG